MVYKVAFEHLSKNQPKALSVTRHLSSEQNIYNVSILKSNLRVKINLSLMHSNNICHGKDHNIWDP